MSRMTTKSSRGDWKLASTLAHACIQALEDRRYFGIGWFDGGYVPEPQEETEDPIIDCGCNDDGSDDFIDDGIEGDMEGGGDGGPQDSGSSGPPSSGAGNSAKGSDAAKSGSGEVKANSRDLPSTFGVNWGLTRSWVGVNGASPMGNGWMTSQAPYLTIVRNQHATAHGGIVQVVHSDGQTLQFAIGTNSNTFEARGRTIGNRLIYHPPTSSPNEPGYFELIDKRGNSTTFYDLPRSSGGGTTPYIGRINAEYGKVQGVTQQWTNTSTGTVSQTAAYKYRFGALRSHTDVGGGFIVTPQYDVDGNVTDILLVKGTSTYERYHYSYTTLTYQDALHGISTSVDVLSSVSLQRASDDIGPWTTLRTVEYEYYDGTNAHGRLGDLKLVTISRPDNSTEQSVTLARIDSTVTATISAGHTYAQGDLISIRDAVQSEYNGTFTVTGVSGNTLTFEVTGTPASTATGSIKAYHHITMDQKYYRYYKFHTFNHYTGNITALDGMTQSGGVWYDNAGGTDPTFPRQNADTVPEPDRSADNIVMSGLKSVIEGAELTRLIANYGSFESLPDIDVDPTTDLNGDGIGANDDIRSYANHFYKYERYYNDTVETTAVPMTRYRVIEDIAAGEGCSTCSGGLGTTKRVYDVNPNWKADPYDGQTDGVDPNKWVMKTTEYFPDTTNNVKTLSSGELTSSGTTATVTWNNHGFIVGDHIQIAGAAEGAYNGTFTIASVAANSFTYTLPSDPVDTATGNITVTNFDRIATSSWDDNDYQIIYTNEVGQLMLRAVVDRNGTTGTGDDKRYLTYHRYTQVVGSGTEGRVEFIAHPSAVLSYEESHDDLVSWGTTSGDHAHISPTSGMIEHYTYASSTTATTSAAGDVVDILKGYSLKEGYSGSDVWVYTQDYIAHSYSGSTVYPVATYVQHREGNLGSTADDLVTEYLYTWLEDSGSVETNRIESKTTSFEDVETSQNGLDDEHDETVVFFDVHGRPIWEKDAAGFITYTAYDAATGAVVSRIVDVDTTETADFSNLPDGWSTVGGGGAHLKTSMVVDGLGRTTKLTDPNGNITYTVYNDESHEVRVYRGWNTSTHLPSSPIEITRQRVVDSEETIFSEYVTSTAIPTLSGSNEPTGEEAISSWNIMSLSRSITNDAGQVIEKDVYFSLKDVNYTTTTAQLGSVSNNTTTGNYHATFYEYDGRGRLKRTQSPSGTISRTLYDVRGLVLSNWTGTDDTPASGYWSPSNTTGTNLVKVSEHEYDHGDVGTGNRTQTTSFPGGSADPRVTEMWYDWRNRLTAIRQAADIDGTHPAVTFYTYDNLDRITTTDTYGSDLHFVDFGSLEDYNWSFEGPVLATNAYEYNPDSIGASWVFDDLSGVAESFLGVTPPEGEQMAVVYLDDLGVGGTIEQSLTLINFHEYTFSFKVVATAPDAYLQVELAHPGGDTEIYNESVSNTASWAQIDIENVLWQTGQTLRFSGSEGVSIYLMIDDVEIYDETASLYVANWGENAGFEDPDLDLRSLPYEFNPHAVGAVWLFEGNSGIARNGSGLSNPSAPGGSQAAFLQTLLTSGGSIEQDIEWDDGIYRITFAAAQRTGNDEAQTVLVYIDNELVGTYTPGGTSFAEFTTDPFEVEEGTHTLRLVTGNTTADDSVAFIDGVVVSLETQIPSSTSVPERPDDSYLRSRSTTEYDDRGRVFASHVFSAHPVTGVISDSLDTNYWYDSRGNAIKVSEPGGLVTKTQFDGAGRVMAEFQTDGGGDSVYANADDVVGDNVLSQVEYEYDDNGNAILITRRERSHNETLTGALGDVDTGPTARVSYVRNYYDKLNRVLHSVNVGTYNGDPYDSSTDSTVPARSDTKLVTSYEYASDEIQVIQITGTPTSSIVLDFGGDTLAIDDDADAADLVAALEGLASIDDVFVEGSVAAGFFVVKFMGDLTMHNVPQLEVDNGGGATITVSTYVDGNSGRLSRITDPRTTDMYEQVPVTLFNYDMLGRKTQTVEGYDHTAPLLSSSNNRKTQQTYNGNGSVLTLTAVLPDDAIQETAYIYGVAGGGSDIYSNDLLAEVRYPTKSGGSAGQASATEDEDFTYNALGERTSYTDRNGNVHEYEYDVLGRMTSDAITTLGSDVDDAVLRIEYRYDDAGRLYQVTSYDDEIAGNVVSQIQREYNGLGQLTTEYQAHSGPVNTTVTPKMEYTFSEMDGGANHSRLTKITYPNGRIVRHEYGTSGNVVSDDVNNSISRLTYLADDSSGSVGTHLEEYEYLGLETVVKRVHPQPGVDLTYLDDDTNYGGDGGDQYAGLDRFGRIIDQRWTTSGWTDKDRYTYTYDRNSNVLTKDNELNATYDDDYTYDDLDRLTSFVRNGVTKDWTLDALGNWDSVDGESGDRDHNAQNQATSVGGETLTYDDNGNLITNQNGYTLIYDAWNRLIEVRADTGSGSTISSYSYDGLGRKITQTPATQVRQVPDSHSGGGDNPTPTVGRTKFPISNGILFYVAQDENNTAQLHKTDGTVSGTGLVKVIRALGTNINHLTAVGNVVFFTADDGTSGLELWMSDGTSTGTVMVKDIVAGSGSGNISNLVNLNGTLFFSASNGSGVNGQELWKSNGTSTGTVMVRDIRSGTASSSPANLAAVGSTLFFTANEGTNGVELWKSDGTSAGTVMVKNISAGSSSSTPTGLTDVGGTLFFIATDGTNGRELWSSNGDSTGTNMVKDINPGSSNSSVSGIVDVSGTAFFQAGDGTNGAELWKSNGTSAGTVMVKDIHTSGSSSPANFMNVNGTLFFSADDGTNGTELWKSDGSSGGTVMVKDINSGSSASMGLNSLAVVGSTLYFNSNDGIHGDELWKSDGTSGGTSLVTNLRSSSNSSTPQFLTNLNGQVHFRATNSGGAIEMYVVDTRTTDLYYTDQWQVAEERISGQTTRQYVWSPVYVDAMVLRDSNTDGDGQADDQRLYVSHDANFNVTALMDTGGNVIERYLYDPYGAPLVRDAGWGADGDGLSDVSWNYLHQGGRYDSGAGLYHFRHREYDPSLGRWVQVDPLGTPNVDPKNPSVSNPLTVKSFIRAAAWSSAEFGGPSDGTFVLWSLKDGQNRYQLTESNILNSTDPAGLDRYLVHGGMGHYAIAVDVWSTGGNPFVIGTEQYDFSVEYWTGPFALGAFLFGSRGRVTPSPGIGGTVVATLPSGPCADLILKGNLDAAVINPPIYHIGFYNCNWFALNHLLDGLPVPKHTPDNPIDWDQVPPGMWP